MQTHYRVSVYEDEYGVVRYSIPFWLLLGKECKLLYCIHVKMKPKPINKPRLIAYRDCDKLNWME